MADATITSDAKNISKMSAQYLHIVLKIGGTVVILLLFTNPIKKFTSSAN